MEEKLGKKNETIEITNLKFPKKKIKLKSVDFTEISNHLLKGRLYKTINSNIIMSKELVEEIKEHNSLQVYKCPKKQTKKFPDIMTNKSPELIKKIKSPDKFEDDYFEPMEIISKKFSKSEIKTIQNHPRFFQTHENSILKEIKEFSPKKLAEMINLEDKEKEEEEEKKLFKKKYNNLKKKRNINLPGFQSMKLNDNKYISIDDNLKENSINNKFITTFLTNKLHKKRKVILNQNDNLNIKTLNYLDKLSKTEKKMNMTETNFNKKMKIFEEKRNDLRTIYFKKFHRIRRFILSPEKHNDTSNNDKKFVSNIIGQLVKNYSIKNK